MQNEEEEQDTRLALVYKLPDKNYKYTHDELLELTTVYLERRLIPKVKPRPNHHPDWGGINTLFFILGFIPMWIFCFLVIWYATGGDNLTGKLNEMVHSTMSNGGLFMSSLILTILVLLGLGGIISRLYYLSEDTDDRNAEDLLARELNAHTQIIEDMGREFMAMKESYEKDMSKSEKSAYDLAKYKKMYQEMKSKNDKLKKQVQRLETKVLNQDTVIAKLNNTLAKKKDNQ